MQGLRPGFLGFQLGGTANLVISAQSLMAVVDHSSLGATGKHGHKEALHLGIPDLVQLVLGLERFYERGCQFMLHLNYLLQIYCRIHNSKYLSQLEKFCN